MEKSKETTKGTVMVTVQQSDRMGAINNLSEAVCNISKALASNVNVSIDGCTFQGPEIGVKINTSPEINETMVEKI